MSNLKIRIRKIIASYFPALYIDIEWWRLFGKKMDKTIYGHMSLDGTCG